MENIIKTIEKDIEELSKKIGILSDYTENNHGNEDENILKMQMFQMLGYRDILKLRLNKLK